MSTTTDGFEQRIESHRSELLAYCYRMLGSSHDAEDLVQEVLLRAWRARDRYDESRASLRTWLYRIASNACSSALEANARRPLPSGLVGAADPRGPLVASDVPWLQPLPDAMLRAGELEDPAAIAAQRGTLRLAFVSALQLLSARERGALILRDVLGFSAAEAAEILEASVAAVNSALQRARTRVEATTRASERTAEPTDAEQRAWVDRYMAAFVRADIEAIKRLLTLDVLMEMPPMVNWFVGTEDYGAFMEWVFEKGGSDWRLLPIAANGQAGFAAYAREPDGEGFALHTVQVFTVTAQGICRNSVFRDAEVFASFGLAPRLDADDGFAGSR